MALHESPRWKEAPLAPSALDLWSAETRCADLFASRLRSRNGVEDFCVGFRMTQKNRFVKQRLKSRFKILNRIYLLRESESCCRAALKSSAPAAGEVRSGRVESEEAERGGAQSQHWLKPQPWHFTQPSMNASSPSQAGHFSL
jgi:hypothetical protein